MLPRAAQAETALLRGLLLPQEHALRARAGGALHDLPAQPPRGLGPPPPAGPAHAPPSLGRPVPSRLVHRFKLPNRRVLSSWRYSCANSALGGGSGGGRRPMVMFSTCLNATCTAGAAPHTS